MRREDGGYTPDTFNRLKEIFLGNPGMTLKELAAMSQQVCGQVVEYDSIKARAKLENWEIERNGREEHGSEVKPIDIVSEVNHIRQIVYQQIVAANENGIMLTGNFDIEATVEYLNSLGIEGIKIVRLRPGGVDSTMVNAYMNLLSKSNVRLDIGGTSGKTAREQVLDLRDEAKRELDEYNRSVAVPE